MPAVLCCAPLFHIVPSINHPTHCNSHIAGDRRITPLRPNQRNHKNQTHQSSDNPVLANQVRARPKPTKSRLKTPILPPFTLIPPPSAPTLAHPRHPVARTWSVRAEPLCALLHRIAPSARAPLKNPHHRNRPIALRRPNQSNHKNQTHHSSDDSTAANRVRVMTLPPCPNPPLPLSWLTLPRAPNQSVSPSPQPSQCQRPRPTSHSRMPSPKSRR